MNERRREQRFYVAAPAALKPVGSVAASLQGEVVDVSGHGVRVRVAGLTATPKAGDLYRILSSDDRMLCQVAHTFPGAKGTDIGFKIVYWSETGKLNQVVANRVQPVRRDVLRELKLPRFV